MNATDTTALVVHPTTGEVLDLRDADTEQLAAAVEGLGEIREQLNDFASLVDTELLGRLDKRASWTLRVGDPKSDVQYEIKAPSPEAGTEGYDAVVMEDELRTLVARDTIDVEGAEAALERTVTVTVKVPLDHDLESLVQLVKQVDAIAGVPCVATAAGYARKVSLRGVNALRKVDGTGRALDRAQITLPTPTRRVKVTAIRKDTRV